MAVLARPLLRGVLAARTHRQSNPTVSDGATHARTLRQPTRDRRWSRGVVHACTQPQHAALKCLRQGSRSHDCHWGRLQHLTFPFPPEVPRESALLRCRDIGLAICAHPSGRSGRTPALETRQRLCGGLRRARPCGSGPLARLDCEPCGRLRHSQAVGWEELQLLGASTQAAEQAEHGRACSSGAWGQALQKRPC